MTYCLYNWKTEETIGCYYSWSEASEASQNYGPEWVVKENND